MPTYKDKKGSWYFKVSINGRQFLRRGFASKQQARDEELRFRFENGAKKINKVPTFNFLVKDYLKYYKQKVKISTYYSVEKMAERYFIGKFPDIEVNKILFVDLIKWRKMLIDAKLKDYSKIFSTLNNLYDYTFTFYNITLNNFKKILPIKSDKVDYTILKTKKKYLTIEELKLFLDCVDDSKDKIMFSLAAITGLRIGELRALQPCCLQGNYLYIFENAISKNGLGHTTYSSPKTKKSIRRYILPDNVKNLLSIYIEENKLQEKNRLFYGINKNKSISETSINRKLLNYSKKAGFDFKINFHMFRHTVATLLRNDNKINVKAVEDYLGHTAGVTDKFYNHNESGLEIEKVLEKILI